MFPPPASTFPWPKGRRCAVSLTFDDARPSQIDVGVPILDRHGVRATFYVMVGRVAERLSAWSAARDAGHELGNHTRRHPCSGNFAFARKSALEDYTLEQMEAELLSVNDELQKLIGVRPRSFAYPCGQTFVGRGEQLRSYIPIVAKHFLVGRTFLDECSNDPSYSDLARLAGTGADGVPWPTIQGWIDQIAQCGGWLALVAHEVSPTGRQAMHPDVLDAICRYCADPTRGIWIDTVANVGAYVQELRSTAT
jgi:peptidoglycan/xylan/chitin deacetylase (PgdA/CDA1 family)